VIMQSYVRGARHGASGVLLRQTSFPFSSKLSKSVFNVRVTRD
jgi:hypothetical protein